MGHLERRSMGSHFLYSFLRWFGFAWSACHIQFSLPFPIAVGLAALSVFGHSDSCILGLGEAIAD